jgi:AcrR family transcriptional regulator
MLSSDAIVTVMTVTERQQRDRARRRQAIITAARQLAEAEGWDAVTIRRLADQIEYSQPVLYSHFAGKGDIIDAVAVEGFAKLRLILQNARQAAVSPEAALGELAGAYVGFAQEHPALYDAMFTLSTELPFGRPEGPRELHAAFAELREAVTPLAGGRDPETLAEVAWSALHGIATLTRTGRLRPDYHQARLTMLAGQLAGMPG